MYKSTNARKLYNVIGTEDATKGLDSLLFQSWNRPEWVGIDYIHIYRLYTFIPNLEKAVSQTLGSAPRTRTIESRFEYI